MSKKQKQMNNSHYSKLEEWREWLDYVWKELNHLREMRLIYLQMAKLINQNSQTFAYTFFRHWLLINYSTCASLSVRRLVDNDNRTFSLIVLLRDICSYHSLITRTKYTEMMVEKSVKDVRYRKDPKFFIKYKRIKQKKADREFTKLVGKVNHLNPFDVKREMEEINNISSDIKKFVNQFIAHSQKGKKISPPSFVCIASCLTTLTKIFLKYDKLITGRSSHFGPSKQEIEKQTKTIFEKGLCV